MEFPYEDCYLFAVRQNDMIFVTEEHPTYKKLIQLGAQSADEICIRNINDSSWVVLYSYVNGFTMSCLWLPFDSCDQFYFGIPEHNND